MGGPFGAEHWSDIQTELTGLYSNLKAWEYVCRTPNIRVLPSTWPFKWKRRPNGEATTFKLRVVAHGDCQVEGIDYFQTVGSRLSLVNYSHYDGSCSQREPLLSTTQHHCCFPSWKIAQQWTHLHSSATRFQGQQRLYFPPQVLYVWSKTEPRVFLLVPVCAFGKIGACAFSTLSLSFSRQGCYHHCLCGWSVGVWAWRGFDKFIRWLHDKQRRGQALVQRYRIRLPWCRYQAQQKENSPYSVWPGQTSRQSDRTP